MLHSIDSEKSSGTVDFSLERIFEFERNRTRLKFSAESRYFADEEKTGKLNN